MNQYSVTSDYGPFSAPSDARLRRLVRELAAIAELKVIHESNAFAKATVEAGKGVVQGAQNLINRDRCCSGTGIQCVRPRFGGGQTRRQKPIRRWRGAELLAVSSFKRGYAQKLDVHVYSSNEVLQKELNSVASAAAAANLTLGAASMVTGAAVLQAASGFARSIRPKTSSTHYRRLNCLAATGRPCAKWARRMWSPTAFFKTTCFRLGIKR